MTQEQDLRAFARSIVDANRFMALGTADASGTPWVSPVWYVPLSSRESWAAVYLVAVAEELEEVDVELEAFNRRSQSHGLRAWSRDELVPPGEFRLYRATASEQFVLDDHDARLPVHLEVR
jgi:hypothetical protein